MKFSLSSRAIGLGIFGAAIMVASCDRKGAPALQPPKTYVFPLVASYRASDSAWDYAAVDAAKGRLLIGRGDGVLAVNLLNGGLKPGFVAAPGVAAAILSFDGKTGLATRPDANEVVLFDRGSGAVIARLAVGHEPDAATLDEQRRVIYVVNHGSGTISVVDPIAKRIVRTIDVGGKLEGAAIGDDGRLYVNAEDRNDLAIIDLDKGAVVRRIALPGCEEPKGMVADRARGLIFSACANGMAKIIATQSGAVTGDAPIGKWSDAAMFDAALQRLITTNWEGTVSIVDLSDPHRPKPLATLRTVQGMRTGAFSPDSGRLYVVGSEQKVISESEDPATIPGTFRVMVFDLGK